MAGGGDAPFLTAHGQSERDYEADPRGWVHKCGVWKRPCGPCPLVQAFDRKNTIHFKDPSCSREDLWPVETHGALGTGRPQAPLACGLLCDAHRTLQRSEPSVLSDEHKDHRTQWCPGDR